MSSALVAMRILGRELVDQPAEPDAPLDRGIVCERENRSPPEAQLARDARLEDAVRRLEPLERALPFLLGAEHAHVDRGLREILRRLDAGDGDEADPGVLQVRDR